MIALISLFVIIAISIIVVRIGAIALELTGIPKEVASFQAQSAFSGTGFTTAEAEDIVSHAVRRKIIRILIMLGSAGLTSSIATLVMAFIGESRQTTAYRGALLVGGLLGVYLFARSKIIYNFMERIITCILQRNVAFTVINYKEILGLSNGYGIATFKVNKDSWLIGKPLKSLDIRKEGILILTIRRKVDGNTETIGAPTADVIIQAYDELVCYGKTEAIRKLADRLWGRAGDREHDRNVQEEQQIARQEESALEDATGSPMTSE